MRIFAIADTHGLHRQLIIPDNIDMLLYAGDATNSYGLNQNLIEFEDFFNWIDNLNIKHKILIAGNHDAWATKKYNRDKLAEAGVIYLENEYANIEGKVIFGSPWTPNFGNWYFMRDSSKMDDIWKHLEPNIDILLTHGPPKGILDLSENKDYKLEQCGDVALYKRIVEKRPKYVIFGHLHDYKTCKNFGTLTRDFGTTFMNVSCIEDGKFEEGLKHNGIVFEI